VIVNNPNEEKSIYNATTNGRTIEDIFREVDRARAAPDVESLYPDLVSFFDYCERARKPGSDLTGPAF